MSKRNLYGVALPASPRQFGRLIESARLAEDLGADLVTVSDHPYLPSELETFTLLAQLAGRTERVLVAPNVAPLTLRPPAMLAKSAATLQFVSGGRFVLGLGVGGPYEMTPGFGGAWPGIGQAISALDEAVPLIRRLWGPRAGTKRPAAQRLGPALGERPARLPRPARLRLLRVLARPRGRTRADPAVLRTRPSAHGQVVLTYQG
ncbi:LLM class flavin-dependent oxidoreductase [Nonomuraea sp. 3N208]|uniref:LLM class flavin-dependent oxidoreductase n=1 Tax=Nonomuraea sp. 3N208 TaxID=3457421 RepID=UPI003FD56281